jgi:hypothetical protein
MCHIHHAHVHHDYHCKLHRGQYVQLVVPNYALFFQHVVNIVHDQKEAGEHARRH